MQSTHGKMSFRKKLRRAFTITELVIVIAVIAILAAVLIPTFSNVIENSKRSHDEQFTHEINVALSGYEATYGRSPANYEELMLALNEYELCDASNPFLLATSLKQDNMYLIWYPNTNSVVLLDGGNSSDYIIQFSSSDGYGNSVYVFDKTAAGGTQAGYALCTTGSSSGEIAAQLYYDIYITNGGDVGAFLSSASGQAIVNTISGMTDTAWGNAILGSLTNQQQGYSYSESVANSIKTQAQNSSTISIGVTAPSGTDEESQAGAQQSVRTALATLTRLANTTADAEVLAGKTIMLAANDANVNAALAGVTVDMSEVQMTAIGNVYRKDYEGKTGSVNRSSFSVNFGGLTLQNMTVAQNELVSSGAEHQEEKDCSYPGGAYVFTYGLFGTINAEPGDTVTISNLTIDGVDMNLTGASETISGTTYTTITDMAGVVAGYTQGNVVFDNIDITGLNNDGEFTGFDGVAAIVGRAYSSVDGDTLLENSSLTIRNCTVTGLNVNGQRRAAGFVGYAGRGIQVTIENSSFTNVAISCIRTDGSAEIFSGAIGHFAGDTSLTINGLTLKDVDTTIAYSTASGSNRIEIWEENYPKGQNLDKCYYINPEGSNNYLIYLFTESGFTLKSVSNFNIEEGGQTYTLTLEDMVCGKASVIA